MKSGKDREPWEGHRERLRNRAETEGLDALRESHLIELLLCYAVPRMDVSEVAKALTDRFGTAVRVVSQPRKALMSVPGVTRAMADWLMMTGELLSAYGSADPLSPHRIWRFRDLMCFLDPLWREVAAPQCWVLYTDFDGRLLMRTVLCESLDWAEPQYAARIVEEALSVQARNAFLVLFTGALSQEPEPWELQYMLALSRTLRAIGVELLDCAIVSEEGMISLNLRGQMDQIAGESPELALHERYREE